MLDYSFARPDPAAIHAAGVIRYLSSGHSGLFNPKDLTAPEASELHAAGLKILLVWETYATRASASSAAGAWDAGMAEAQADALGYPSSAAIFYAVDFDARPIQVAAYFEGIVSVAHHPVGIYGSADVVEGKGAGIPYVWQCAAWSHGRVSPTAHLYQRLTPTVPNPPDTDENVVIGVVPCWDPTFPRPMPWETAPTNTPGAQQPKPAEGLTVRTIDLRNAAAINVTGANIPPLQRLLGVNADGYAGALTRAALVSAQTRMRLAPDAIFGPLTASGLLAGQ